MKLKSVFSAVCLAASFALSPLAQASLITETTDAPNYLADAMVVGSDTTQILGQLSHGQDADVFKFTLTSNAILTIEVMEISPELDMNLLVFNALGQGIAGDDDNNDSCNAVSVLSSLDSCLTLTLSAGDYFFGVGDNNIGAFESEDAYNNANDFFDNDFGILDNPTSKIAVLIGPEGGPSINGDIGDYQINLYVTAVPEPATLALFGAGLFAMFRRRMG